MTCRFALRQLADYLDTPDSSALAELRAHLDACGACTAEFTAARAALSAIAPARRVQASFGFKERTMNKLQAELAAAQAPKRSPWLRPVFRLAFSAGLILAIILALPYFAGNQSHNGGQSGAVALLAQSAQAMSALQTVHITARMRTLPADNFDLIGVNYEFVPVEMWKDFSAPPKWRIQKPGRLVVVDGAASLLLIQPNQAMRGGVRNGFATWLQSLLDADQILQTELAVARQGKSQASLTQGTDPGSQQLVLHATRQAEGDFTNPWLRNRTIYESDHTRSYRFDAATGRLTGLQIVVHDAGRDVVVFEITAIRYNEVLPAELFALTVPENVTWLGTAADLPVTGAIPATPREAALAFFEGAAAGDWQKVASVYTLDDRLKKYLTGIQVISVGEPFKSGIYPGWFVPYEIVMSDGHNKQHKLAVRNDNPQKRFIIDGGF